MRLRLVHQLSLLMLCAVMSALLLMAAAIGWNVRTGFVDYLEARDAERLDRFVAIAQKTLAVQGVRAIEARPDALRGLLDQLARSEGLPLGEPFIEPPEAAGVLPAAAAQMPPRSRAGEAPDAYRPRPPRDRDREDGRRPPPPHDRPPHDRPPHDRPPHGDPRDWPPRDHAPPAPPPAFESPPPPPQTNAPAPPPWRRPPPPETHRWGEQLSIEDSDGRVLVGHVRQPAAPSLTRAIVVEGQTIATARLYLASHIPAGVEARFLSRQYGAIATLTVVLAVLSILVSVVIAHRWLRPIKNMQAGAQQLAKGDFKLRLPPGGQDELGELTQHMNVLAASLEKLEAARRRWIAELSHELRTPLSVLRGELEALQDGIRVLDVQAIGSLQTEVAHITRLIDDLHQLAMFDLEKMPCRFEPLDAVTLIEAAIGRARARAEAAGVTLHFRHPSHLSAMWDGGRITQLVGNLLENSIKYTDAPGRIHVLLSATGDTATLTVEDTPPGVRDFELGMLFEPLYRADPSRNRNKGGSGLGLAIVDSIARAHGGRMSAGPSDLGGVMITATLPLRPV